MPGGATVSFVDDRPVALFDSGFGGLTVARAVMDLLPDESLVYLGDTARYPYGPRPLDEVASFALEIAEELVERRDAKALVVACNTASAAALDELQKRYEIPVLGVIDPGVRAMVSATRNGRVAVIGTVGTIESKAYQTAVMEAAPELHLTALACPGFVEFVERGELDSHQVHVLAERLLAPASWAGVDTLLLGCTHYPYLARTISDVMGRGVVLVSSADETAFEIRRMIEDGELVAATSTGAAEPVPDATFLTTGDVARFAELGSQMLGPELAAAERVQVG